MSPASSESLPEALIFHPLSVRLTQLNVPLAGIGLVMGLDSLLGMMRAMSNSRILDRCKIRKEA